jgi:hypothetical protein
VELGPSRGERREAARDFGYQPITSGSPPLVNFAQIRLRKRITIFGIRDQKRSYQIQGEWAMTTAAQAFLLIGGTLCLSFAAIYVLWFAERLRSNFLVGKP